MFIIFTLLLLGGTTGVYSLYHIGQEGPIAPITLATVLAGAAFSAIGILLLHKKHETEATTPQTVTTT